MFVQYLLFEKPPCLKLFFRTVKVTEFHAISKKYLASKRSINNNVCLAKYFISFFYYFFPVVSFEKLNNTFLAWLKFLERGKCMLLILALLHLYRMYNRDGTGSAQARVGLGQARTHFLKLKILFIHI